MALELILETIRELTAGIQEHDRELEYASEEFYSETRLLGQVKGVGQLTALAFVSLLEDLTRFERSRAVGSYVELVPGRTRLGDSDPQRHICRYGNELLRRLLVGCAHYILGPFGEDSDLRRNGEKTPKGAARTLRNVLRWRWQGNSRCCFAPPVDFRRGSRLSLQR
jgi:transposase